MNKGVELDVTHEGFLGTWQIERVIEDHSTNSTSYFVGQAHICKSENSKPWIYAEDGTMQIPGVAPLKAQRRYLWTVTKTGFAALFEDGRKFHDISFSVKSTSDHWCDPDQYDVIYGFTTWPRWTSIWRVRGPRKDYTMSSAYTPFD